MTDAIIEAAAQALFAAEMPGSDWRVLPSLHDKFRARARAITPLIEEAALKRWAHDLAYVRARAFEEAAKVAEGFSADALPSARKIAAAIRAMKEQP